MVNVRFEQMQKLIIGESVSLLSGNKQMLLIQV